MKIGSKTYKATAGGTVAAIVAAAVQIAIPFIQPHEGRSLVPYLDIVGVWTYCDGETENVNLTKTYKPEECDEITRRRVSQTAAEVYKLVNHEIDLPPLRHAAFTSFAYNVGVGAFERSTMRRLFNEGDIAGACDQFDRWMLVSTPRGSEADRRDRKGGLSAPVDGKKDCFVMANKCSGIKKRRQEEQNACRKGL